MVTNITTYVCVAIKNLQNGKKWSQCNTIYIYMVTRKLQQLEKLVINIATYVCVAIRKLQQQEKMIKRKKRKKKKE